MLARKLLGSPAALALIATFPSAAFADTSDAQIAAVIDEGLNRSEAMTTASALMDGIGPRLTNSENFRRAADWATARMATMGLKNVHREAYDFGLGWNLDSWSARMVVPRVVTMTAMPVAWSPPTAGSLRSASVRTSLNGTASFPARSYWSAFGHQQRAFEGRVPPP